MQDAFDYWYEVCWLSKSTYLEQFWTPILFPIIPFVSVLFYVAFLFWLIAAFGKSERGKTESWWRWFDQPFEKKNVNDGKRCWFEVKNIRMMVHQTNNYASYLPGISDFSLRSHQLNHAHQTILDCSHACLIKIDATTVLHTYLTSDFSLRSHQLNHAHQTMLDCSHACLNKIENRWDSNKLQVE